MEFIFFAVVMNHTTNIQSFIILVTLIVFGVESTTFDFRVICYFQQTHFRTLPKVSGPATTLSMNDLFKNNNKDIYAVFTTV